ncbi:MAG: protein kinase [Gemmataceae bacterium]|nr:protein kinase [Gemmataceae bacterium]MCI0742650.1 protein kinase [Gemmataceae bacterium]
MQEQSIFIEALEKADPAERAAFLDQACAGDPVLRQRLDRLLARHQHGGSFLDSPASGPDATVDAPIDEGPGTVIGPYKLLEQIGEGGFGVVFMAEQSQPVRRKVALKILKPGMDTRQVVARFEAERQALAIMDHPNIAKVHDGGATPSGRPFVVMELVKGVPITEYCDQHHLTPRQRLELFVPVCHAVQHAHQKGIIHRDLKPSNILVVMHDTTPVPKIIDFGIAKALGQELTDKTLFTGFAQMVGTPLYMSPEQAGQSSLDIDTRSDIFSLGVLLYELLTGTTPFSKERFRQAAYDEIRRIIREEEPPKPSTRLSDSGEALASISANRHTEPAKLTKLVRGELDWIVMKCLEKDRNRRYETANGFALDVQRFLNDEPVQACPASLGYRLRKFARRNKRGLLLALLLGVLSLLLVVGIPVTAVLQNERDRALENLKRAELAEAQARDAEKEIRIRAHLARAAAARHSRQPGQRFACLEEIGEALKLDPSPELRAELRTEAVASLALPDLHLTEPLLDWPANWHWHDFDEAHARYARIDRQGTCSIRRVDNDSEIYRMPGRGLCYLSSDGKFVAIVQQNKLAELWHLDGVTPRRVLSEGQVWHVDFHRNSEQVALTYKDGSIGLFELPSGQSLHRLPPDTITRELTVALHPTEPVVAVCSYFGTVVLLRDLRTGNVLNSLPQDRRPSSIAWHPDGRILAVGMAEAKVIRLYDRTCQLIRTLESWQQIDRLAFNHAGDRLAANGWSSILELFDVNTGQKLFATKAAGGCIPRFRRDDGRLAGTIQDGKLGIWQVADGREFQRLVTQTVQKKTRYGSVTVHPDGRLLSSVTVHPDGRLLAAATPNGFGLWDLVTGSEVAFVSTPGGDHHHVLFEPSGAILSLGPIGLTRWPVRIESGSVDQLVVGPPEPLPLPNGHGLGQSRDGRVIVTCARAISSQQPYAGGWILHADRPDAPIHVDSGADIVFISISPNGRWVITVNMAESATIWDARDGSRVKQLAEWGAGNPVFSPDGRWLSTNLDGGRVFVVPTWEPGPKVGAWGRFSPDSQVMAIQPTIGAVRLVDSATRRELVCLEDPDFTATYSAQFSPDGTKLIGMNNGIRVWDLRLIRRQLAEMGLDWDAPPYPPANPKSKSTQPLKVVVRHGDSATVALSRAQRSKRDIDHFRRAQQATPDSAYTCDNLARVYLTAPESLRDVEAALPLAKKAVRLAPKIPMYGNTLALAYYRNGLYPEAAEILRPNLDRLDDPRLVLDLYLMAMCHHRLGDKKQARAFFDWAGDHFEKQNDLSAKHLDELDMFRAEASKLMGIATRSGVELGPPPRESK